jgi:hypothetical protein
MYTNPFETVYYKQFNKKGYLRIPDDLLQHRNKSLTPGQLLIFILLLSHCNKKTLLCYPSYVTLAEESGYSRWQVERIIKDLKTKKVIDYSKNGSQHGSNLYNAWDFDPIFRPELKEKVKKENKAKRTVLEEKRILKSYEENM